MQGAIDWSGELLEPWDQTALAQCSVFRGSFVLEAAENVVDLSEHGQASPVFDVLQTLRDKSLVRALPPAPGTDAPRLALFPSIRDYAAERESATAGVAAGRMAAYFVPMAERLTAAVDESEGHRALDRLVADRDNLLAIVHRAIDRRPPSCASTRTARWRRSSTSCTACPSWSAAPPGASPARAGGSRG